MHIIHGLTLRLTVQAEIQFWDKRRYLSSRKKGWGDNIPDKREVKARHRQTQRRKQKQEERDNETCMKNLNHGGRQGLVKAHCSSSAVCDWFRACCVVHEIGTQEFKLQTSFPLCNKDSKFTYSYCHHETMLCTKSLFIAHGFMLQLLPTLRGKDSSVVLPSAVTSSVK